MTIPELQELLDVYGTKAERWPEELRLGAQDLINKDPAAAALVAEWAPVDNLMAPKKTTPPNDLLARILKNTEEN